ncbi:MAG: right-handed parallel beta-helix repeat-containing protein, partial [Pontibacter sp.]|nr:right-handed parallel beta-helix repeat-containing protein [Pontibacter sp.]
MQADTDISGFRNITIRGNTMKGHESGWFVYAAGHTGGMRNLKVESNEIDGSIVVYYGLINSSIADNKVKSITFINDYVYSGYSLSALKGNIISGNVIKATSQSGSGITATGYGLAEVTGNRITGITNSSGILLTSVDGALVSNNFVQTQGQGTTHGISLSKSSNVKLVFNSVHTTGTDLSQARAFYSGGGNSGLTVKNNIFSNSGGGYAAVFDAAPGGTNDIDYNNYHSSGGKLGKFAGTDYTSLSAWGQAVKGDANSKAVNPFFKSTTEPSINHISLNNAGITVGSITKDIDGTTRDASKPDIGAKEYTPAAVDAGLEGFTSPTSPLTGTSVPVKVLLRNQGTNILSSASIQWTVNGVPQIPFNWSGSLASGTSEEV